MYFYLFYFIKFWEHAALFPATNFSVYLINLFYLNTYFRTWTISFSSPSRSAVTYLSSVNFFMNVISLLSSPPSTPLIRLCTRPVSSFHQTLHLGDRFLSSILSFFLFIHIHSPFSSNTFSNSFLYMCQVCISSTT